MRHLLWLALSWAGPDAALEKAPSPDPTGEALVPPLGALPEDLARTAREVRHLPLPDRIKAVSDSLLGLPYVIDPLGEAQAPDFDPLARWDVHDCLTFVEQVLGLAMAGDPADATRIALAMRYGGPPYTYVRRRHFMELQWIPGVVGDGWMRDTTQEYGETVHMEKEVDDALWKRWWSRKNFAHADEELPRGTMRLDVLPLDVAAEAVDRIRPGSVVLTVRIDRDAVPLWITHVGVTIPGETPTMRHASRMGERVVRDDALAWYIEHLRGYTNWPVVGITVLEPIEQGPRRTE